MNTERLKRLEKRVRKTRALAHERIIKDATVQFRLDSEGMERLLTLADERRTGVGVLARMWVLERLNLETTSDPRAKLATLALPPTPIEAQLLLALRSELRSGEHEVTTAIIAQLKDLQRQVSTLTKQVQAFVGRTKKAV